jgi:CHAD domain-containing protein
VTSLEEAAVDGLEIELKYRMSDTAAGDRLLASDDLAGLRALDELETVVNEDRYVDTADGALAAAGYAGRFRFDGAGTLITLKGLARLDDGGAVHRREELEGPADPVLPATSWPASAAREEVVARAGEAALLDLIRIRQVRRKRRYGADGSVVELSVDDVEVLVDDRVIERFAELEVELREGSATVLEPLVDLLAEVEELVPAETSKLERALEAVRHDAEAGLVEETVGVPEAAEPAAAADAASTVEVLAPDGATPGDGEAQAPSKRSTRKVVKARKRGKAGKVPAQATLGDTTVAEGVVDGSPAGAAEAEAPAIGAAPPEPELPRIVVPKTPGVLADDHLAEAGRKVLRFHLARMVAREEGTRAGKDAEELHAMRVATRRQRAAWRVFGEAFDDDRTMRYRRRLKSVAGDLGAVRDLDVLIEAVEAYRERQPPTEAEGLEPLLAGWRTRRGAARIVLIDELDSGRYRRWVDGYVAFVQAEGLGARPVGPTDPHRVRDSMPSRIWAAYEACRAYEPVMRWADVETLHELRIAAKWLRYTLEFVREALGRDAGPVIERVVALQDHLGWLHDADVAAGLARAFLVEHAGDLTEPQSAAIGRYLVDRERELARLRRTVGPPWRGVSSVAFRRALGRVVAGL